RRFLPLRRDASVAVATRRGRPLRLPGRQMGALSTAVFSGSMGSRLCPVPQDAYFMNGAGGQTTLIIPSHQLVVVRLGHYKGSSVGSAGFKKALALLMEAVPRKTVEQRPSVMK